MTKLLSLLGLAKKAGRLAVGTENSIDSVRKGKSALVVASESVSEGTKKLINDKTAYYKTEAVFIPVDTTTFGKAFGKTATACVSVNDQGFADAVKKLLGGN